jgi:hypothetical protein
MWILEIRVMKTIFEPKNETVAGGRRIMTSFKIIRGIKSRRMRGGGGFDRCGRDEKCTQRFGGN